MSAIFGIWDTRGRPLDPAWLAAMQADLAHRGPDGGGVWTEGSVGLGNQLMKVSRASHKEVLPLVEPDLVLVASTRLDDREGLMSRLGIPREKEKDIPDSRLIAAAWRKWGRHCPEHLTGDFAFVLWDRKEKCLFGARDHAGIRPIFHHFENGVFVFSTEIRAVVRSEKVTTSIDEWHLLDMAIGLHDRPTQTPWTGVQRLLPAHAFLVADGQWRMWRYWNLEDVREVRFKDPRDYALGLKEKMEQAVMERLDTDLPVGIPLSGGLDSSSIAVLAAPELARRGQPLYSVSSVLGPDYQGEAKDEMPYIQAVLDQEPWIRPLFVNHGEYSMFGRIGEHISKQYQPLNYFYDLDVRIFEKLEEVGVRRALSGYLGDCTVSNSTVRPLGMYLRQGQPLRALKLWRQFETSYRGKVRDFLAFEVFRPGLPPSWMRQLDIIRNHSSLFQLEQWPVQLTKKQRNELMDRMLRYYYRPASAPRKVAVAISVFPIDGAPPNYDSGGGGYGLEYCYPWMDIEILEYLASLPPEAYRLETWKRGLIRRAMEANLPEAVRLRSDKQAYVPGYRHYIHGAWQELHQRFSRWKAMDCPAWLDITRTLSFIQSCRDAAISDTFDSNYWRHVLLSTSMTFYGEFLQYGPKSRTAMTKPLKKAWNKPGITRVLSIQETLGGLNPGMDVSGKSS